jgi:hypothetical protein
MERERKRVNSSDIKPVTPKNTSVKAAVRVSSLFSNLYKRIKSYFSHKSPCCGEDMVSVLDMERDCLLYECNECKKEYI